MQRYTKLDTLAQLRKRAIRKFKQAPKLEALKEYRPDFKMYQKALACSKILKQSGQTLTSLYCKQRCCNICNSIRSAELINKYSYSVEQMIQPYFVTLTAPTIKAKDLKNRIEEMAEIIRKIADNGRKSKIYFNGIRKLEITYNVEMDWYHPHYHFVIDGQIEAGYLLQKWLEYNPSADIKAQKMDKATEGTLKELFKYAVKETDRKKLIPTNALHTIYETLQKVRTFQTMGKFSSIKEPDEESLPELKSQEVEFLNPDETYWQWEENNWWNVKTGEPLIQEKITIKTKLKNEKMCSLSG
jgi:plasmid rolling circle replication initiator protein Rep